MLFKKKASVMISGSIEDSRASFKKNLAQCVAVMVKNLLLFAFGMTLGYPTILIPSLTRKDPNETIWLDDEQVSWTGSINLLCVPIGCILSGVVTNPIGRRRSMQVITIPLAASWLLFNFCTNVWQIYLALSVTGFCGGLIEAPVLSYVAEITRPGLRGMLSATSTMSLTLGILAVFIIGSFLQWRTVALISLGPPILALILLSFMPESPHWLIMHKKLSQAQRSLAWLRGWVTVDDVKDEFETMCQSHHVESKAGFVNHSFEGSVSNIDSKLSVEPLKSLKNKMANYKHFIKMSFLRPFAMVSFIYFLSMFTGAWTLQTYAVKLFATLNSPMNKYYATILLGFVEFVGTLVCMIIVKTCGKRVVGFVSICAVGMCNIVIGAYAYRNNIQYLQINDEGNVSATPTIDSENWIPLVFLILMALVQHVGMKPLPWILIGEIYSHDTRAIGCGVSSAVSYLCGFLANKVFLNMINSMTLLGTYWFYAALSFVGCIVMYFTLPETEGRSLQEITDHYAGGPKLDNKFRRKRNTVQTNGDLNTICINTISIN